MGRTGYPSKNWVFKNRFSFKFRQQVCWILYKVLVAPSFSQSILWIKSTLQSLPRNSSSSSVNFHFSNSPLLVQKIILTIPTNTPFLYNSAIFHLPLFAYNHPNNLHQKYFPYLKHFGNSGCVKWPGSYGVLWEMTLF